jgi:hypothetical protein
VHHQTAPLAVQGQPLLADLTDQVHALARRLGQRQAQLVARQLLL